MPLPLISVVVPVYNTEPYLTRCLDSLCAQTYRNLEIICVDDGSPDNSINILEEFAARDSRVRVIRQTNQGQAAARNTGLSAVSGEWVSFIDSDDWIEPNTYEECVACISDEIDLLVFGVRVDWAVSKLNAQQEKVSRGLNECFRIKFDGRRTFSEQVILATDVSTCNKLFRYSVIERNELAFPAGRRYEDASFALRFFLVSRSVYFMSHLHLYHYIQRAGSTMDETRQCASYAADYLNVIRDVYDTVLSLNRKTEYQRLTARVANEYIRSALVHAPADKRAEIREEARSIVSEIGISRLGEYDYIYKVFPSFVGFIRRLFRSFKSNKEKFGFWVFKPLVVRHLGDVDIWSFLDVKICTIRKH